MEGLQNNNFFLNTMNINHDDCRIVRIGDWPFNEKRCVEDDEGL